MENPTIDLAAFGQRLRELRERAGLSQPQMAELVGVQRQTISSWEQGVTAPDIRVLFRLKQQLQTKKRVTTDIASLLGEAQPDSGSTPLEYTLRFLEHLDRSGIRDVHPDRSSALVAFLPFLEREHSQVILVASSLLGVTRVAPERVANALREKARNVDDFRALMTHPDKSKLREVQEGRTSGSIAKEIQESAEKLRDDWEVAEENIRFYKGAPTIFLLFTPERMLANPYTYQTEAFKTLTLELAPVSPSDVFARNDVYSQYATNHFHNPWESASSQTWAETFDT